MKHCTARTDDDMSMHRSFRSSSSSLAVASGCTGSAHTLETLVVPPLPSNMSRLYGYKPGIIMYALNDQDQKVGIDDVNEV